MKFIESCEVGPNPEMSIDIVSSANLIWNTVNSPIQIEESVVNSLLLNIAHKNSFSGSVIFGQNLRNTDQTIYQHAVT